MTYKKKVKVRIDWTRVWEEFDFQTTNNWKSIIQRLVRKHLRIGHE